MIRASDFRITTAQTVALTPTSYQLAPARLLSRVMSEASPISFDGELGVFPLPPGAPPEIPRVQLQTKDEQWTLTATQERIAVSWVSKEKTQGIPDEAITKSAATLLQYFGGESE